MARTRKPSPGTKRTTSDRKPTKVAETKAAERENDEAAPARRSFLRGAGKLAGVAALLGLPPAMFTRVVSAQPATTTPVPPTTKTAPPPPITADKLTLARADLLDEYLTSGKLDDAIKKFPNAKLTKDQLDGLKKITPAELKAVQNFRAKLIALKLPDITRLAPTTALPEGFGGGVKATPGTTAVPNGTTAIPTGTTAIPTGTTAIPTGTTAIPGGTPTMKPPAPLKK